jgi:hypothetical protein
MTAVLVLGLVLVLILDRLDPLDPLVLDRLNPLVLDLMMTTTTLAPLALAIDRMARLLQPTGEHLIAKTPQGQPLVAQVIKPRV